ncbi:MAG: quinone-dependent dihydroorotate dehydrogenase [Alphaproteobacteria bacterium]|nr:quinone-dependent dihydroorotate dehydrogenase [Alphaproteobacteria bacterium]
MSSLLDLATGALGLLPPETAHRAALTGLRLPFGRIEAPPASLKLSLFGRTLPSPLGLAAGFDKDAAALAGLFRLGFGFVEAGTVTPKPQAGNPRPRLFRLREDAALINRMGFNSGGIDLFERNVARFRAGPAGAAAVLGINLGANKEAEDKIADYVLGLTRLSDYADYLVVNISSPNTPGLRGLQEGGQLTALLGRLAEARGKTARRPALLLKLAPDLDDDALEALAAAVSAHGLDGLVATNTTIARPPALRSRHRGETGGLSGEPLRTRAQDVLARLAGLNQGRLALIGVGGIGSERDARARLQTGASLVQVYTAFVYRGPRLIHDINRGLAAR